MQDSKQREENEKKKEYLRSYQKALRREKEILDEIQRLRMDKMFPSIAGDGMPRGSSQNDLSDYIVLIDEQIELLKTERLERAKIRSGIERRIREMKDDDEQSVLQSRYIKGLQWTAVADELGYCLRRIHEIHSEALKHFEK